MGVVLLADRVRDVPTKAKSDDTKKKRELLVT